MTTPARRHFQRQSAAKASAAPDPGETINANQYELALLQLTEDKRKLKQLQSIERRIEAKRLMLPAYQPWVDGALAGGKGAQDAVLMTVMVWKLDVGDFTGALEIGAYALEHDLALPDQFKRDLPTLLVEEIADRALQDLGAGEPAPFDALARVHQLVGDKTDMPDEVRAKLFKALGLEYARAAEADTDAPTAAHQRAEIALECLRRALQLHGKAGVKKDIERLERFLKNNPTPTTSETADPPAPGGQSHGEGQPGAGDAAPVG